jgi:hypothetical protein
MFGDSEYIRLVRRVRALSLISIYYDLIWSADISNMHTIICIYDLAES